MESCSSWLCQLLFSGSMAEGFYLPKCFGLQHNILRDHFCHFCRLSQCSTVLHEPAGALGMAEPGSAALNKVPVVSSAAPAGQGWFRCWRFTRTDAVPHCVPAGWLWGRQWQLLSICRQQLHFSCAQRHCSL